jgi:hypothetical protein
MAKVARQPKEAGAPAKAGPESHDWQWNVYVRDAGPELAKLFSRHRGLERLIRTCEGEASYGHGDQTLWHTKVQRV